MANLITKARAKGAEIGQTAIEFSFTFIVVAMLFFGGIGLIWGMVQVAMADYSIGHAEWTTEIDPELAASDPAAAIEQAIALRTPVLAGRIEVKDASISEEVPDASITRWPADEDDRKRYLIDEVVKTPTVRHVKATVVYDISAVVPFTDIAGLTRTVAVDRDVVVTNDFRLVLADTPPEETEGTDEGEGGAGTDAEGGRQ